ncbi:MAG TPA: hypothetical protein P5205_19510 [Candidatus Paceibacterota bacterium]|nr:hypothetical protein [Verrucomicrobiota bacterium]HSA12553.1 hypothetical protein [Candidatus Paceibacterota bacterium]
MKSAPPNGDSVRVAQASPKVLAVVAKATAEMGAAAGAAGAAPGETLIGAWFVYWSAGGGVRVANGCGCCGSQEVVAALAVMGDKLGEVAKGNCELRKDADRLQVENDELRGKLADRFFDFALEVRKDDFWRFAVIMALGNRKAAAEHLEVAERSFYGQIDRWKGERAQGYQTMLRLIAWRKKAGRCKKLQLPDSIASGGTDGKPENPETLGQVLELIKGAENVDYPRLLVMMLSLLRMQNPKNWAKVRDELVEVIGAELSQ